MNNILTLTLISRQCHHSWRAEHCGVAAGSARPSPRRCWTSSFKPQCPRSTTVQTPSSRSPALGRSNLSVVVISSYCPTHSLFIACCQFFHFLLLDCRHFAITRCRFFPFFASSLLIYWLNLNFFLLTIL